MPHFVCEFTSIDRVLEMLDVEVLRQFQLFVIKQICFHSVLQMNGLIMFSQIFLNLTPLKLLTIIFVSLVSSLRQELMSISRRLETLHDWIIM